MTITITGLLIIKLIASLGVIAMGAVVIGIQWWILQMAETQRWIFLSIGLVAAFVTMLGVYQIMSY